MGGLAWALATKNFPDKSLGMLSGTSQLRGLHEYWKSTACSRLR